MITFCSSGAGYRPKITRGIRKIVSVRSVYQGASLKGTDFACGVSSTRLRVQTKYPAVMPGTSTATA